MSGAMAGPLGISESREGSGTAWQPEATPVYGFQAGAGRWSLMGQGNAFLQFIDEGSDRGASQLGSVNWFMGMARWGFGGEGEGEGDSTGTGTGEAKGKGKAKGEGEGMAGMDMGHASGPGEGAGAAARADLTLRAMLSLEPLTVGRCGYPDLLATGELCDGRALHDRQHPHDLFMEVAAQYRQALSRNVAVELYGGPVGDPALGPVAFPHRASALWTPIAPIGHHWEDATHVAFGVVTAGVYGRVWKLEGSAFNGREPDDRRFDFDLGPLDSYAARLWVAPSDKLVVQVSTGYLRAAEQTPGAEARTDVHRTTASLEYELPVGGGGSWASTLVWGLSRAHGIATNAALAESALDLDGRNVLHGRAEVADKTGEDLALDAAEVRDQVFRVGKLAFGYDRVLASGRGRARGLSPVLGAELSLGLVPAALWPFYGPGGVGFAVYAGVHPARMRMAGPAAAVPVPAPLPPPAGEMMMPPSDSSRTSSRTPRP